MIKWSDQKVDEKEVAKNEEEKNISRGVFNRFHRFHRFHRCLLLKKYSSSFLASQEKNIATFFSSTL
jgi:hypothetical protein